MSQIHTVVIQKDGYKTWIDVEQMGGSTLDAMAGAVENAAVVLICASEKYKDSPNCRTGQAFYQKTFSLEQFFMPVAGVHEIDDLKMAHLYMG